ncbi:MAG: PIN domain-containing protein [Bifidobacteriaceae bacterium]|nr:PIN domain-containing protein [Bifidobacteriaceae bacterium]
MTDTLRAVVDTNVTIQAADDLSVELLPSSTAVSAITVAELEVGIAAARSPVDQAALVARQEALISLAEVLPFDLACAKAFGRVAADLRAQGRKVSARSFDALIAATSIANGLPLFTLNPDDFRAIQELDLRPLSPPPG